MRIVIESGADRVAEAAASMVAELVEARPAAVLGLPAGATPLAMYRELVRLHGERGVDFSRISAFALDEFLGLAGSDPRSFRAYLTRHFSSQVNLPGERLNAPDGKSEDPQGECAAYEERIRSAGGLDLVVLGIGADGHIGFNEPGSSLASRTRLKTLTRETRAANREGFEDPEQVPRVALTMGVGTILSARRCLLLATGDGKADAIRLAVEGPITAQVTASALQLHPDAVILLDEGAAAGLERADYYRETERLHRELLAGLTLPRSAE